MHADLCTSAVVRVDKDMLGKALSGIAGSESYCRARADAKYAADHVMSFVQLCDHITCSSSSPLLIRGERHSLSVALLARPRRGHDFSSRSESCRAFGLIWGAFAC